ncbi:glycosyltransferase family 4 protein [Saliphagus infecundisoli]|uniref:Glycosyltransferase family 4 protein n=1 Tax=Saliphagus infecundisoli TaxID=1849069 RepID=A0ABD5QCJ9_9EURY|nr:glycosyltransferase family 4 protein [Saliphagus infecundisoli]
MTEIVHLTSVHQPFDPRIFHKQLRSIAGAGYEATLIAHHERSLVRDGITVLSVGDPDTREERWRNLGRLYRAARDREAALYHCHDPELLPIAVALSMTTDAAVVYDVHEDYADAIRVREWIPPSLKSPLAETFPVVQSLLTDRLDLVVTADDATRDRIAARSSSPVVSVRNFPRVGDSEIGAPPASREAEYVLTYVGGLDRERGLLAMLRTLADLRERGIDAELWLLGPFQDDAIEARARTLMADRGIETHVRLFGYVDYDRIFSYLAAADVGLLLADEDRFARNVPTKFFEYLYCRLPVAMTDVPSLRPYRSDEYATVVPEDEEPADAIADLLADPDRRAEMGESGRRKVIAEYSWEAEKERLLAAYRRILRDTDG